MLINEFQKGNIPNGLVSQFIKESSIESKPQNVKKHTDGKVTFEAYLQESEALNKNGRLYPSDVLNEGVKQIQERIKSRSFIGELDHPISDDQFRQTTVMYKEMSHIIREIGWDGNFLCGVIETAPYSPNGKILSGLVRDRVPVGFSMRGMADIEEQDNIQKVKSPLTIITFDSVSEPSHDKAVVKEIKSENLVSITHESKNVICTDDGKCYLPDHFDQLVEQKLIKIQERLISK